MNSKIKSQEIASWPGVLVSHKETRPKVVLARKLGKQGHGFSPNYTPPLARVLLQDLGAYSEGTTLFPCISVQTKRICFTPPGGP